MRKRARRGQWRRSALLVGLLAAVCWGGAGRTQVENPVRYAIADLGLLPRSVNDIGLALNANGVAAGWRGETSGRARACVWRQGAAQELGLLAGYTETYAAAINANEQVVGLAKAPGDARFCRAFLWEKGRLRDLGALGGQYSSARALNDAGQIVGGATRSDDTMHAFLWERERMQDLGTLAGGDFSLADGVNRGGQVVGAANRTANGSSHAFLWERGRMRDLGLLPGGAAAHAHAINDKGQAVGWAGAASGETHSVLWQNGQAIDLSAPDSDVNAAWDINNRGQIVGNFANARQRMRAFVWEAGRMRDLNALIAPGSGWTLQFACKINDRGQIIGKGLRQGETHAFLLTPLKPGPMPATEKSGAHE